MAPTYSPFYAQTSTFADANDGGIKRGDGENTGVNEADIDDLGSGPGYPTADPTSLGGNSPESPNGGEFDSEEELGEVDGLEVMEASDGRLGLTGLPGSPADDWAADTGKSKNPSWRVGKDQGG